jgi:hypothetical protein
VEKPQDVQSNGESLLFSLFDASSLFLLPFGIVIGISIVPMDILVLLPPSCWSVDGMAEIILPRMSVEIE